MSGRKYRVIAVVVAAAGIALSGCTASDPAPSTTASPEASQVSQNSPGKLFVQKAEGGTTKDGRLSLTGVDPTTLWFQDRPGRDAGSQTTKSFVGDWQDNGFTAEPPNAVLQVGGEKGEGYTLELSDPAYKENNKTLQYAFKVNDGSSQPPSTLTDVSLFIDNAGSQKYQQIKFTVDNTQPGQEVRLTLQPTNGNIAFTTGPDFNDQSGIGVESQSGNVPLQNWSVSPTEVLFATTSAGGDDQELSFTISAWLVAESEVAEFSLTSESNPGVEITLQVGDSAPQEVNTTSTTFLWK